MGFCGYRKYFPFMDNVPDDLTERVDRCGFLAGAEMTQLPSVKEYYRRNHRIEHLDIMDEVISEVSPEFLDMFRKHVNGKKMYICNMFITSAERFREMTEFVFGILDRVTERIMGDVHVYRDASGRPRIRRQDRFGGFLGERLVSAYIASYYPKTEALGMKMTGRALD